MQTIFRNNVQKSEFSKKCANIQKNVQSVYNPQISILPILEMRLDLSGQFGGRIVPFPGLFESSPLTSLLAVKKFNLNLNIQVRNVPNPIK